MLPISTKYRTAKAIALSQGPQTETQMPHEALQDEFTKLCSATSLVNGERHRR